MCLCFVHGANRLGTNSLLDLVAFGKSAGDHIEYIQTQKHGDLPADAGEFTRKRLDRLENQTGGEDGMRCARVANAGTKVTGVFRTDAILKDGVEKIKALVGRAKPKLKTSLKCGTQPVLKLWN